ncbi:transposase, partial [Neisseria meningitidis]
MGRQVPSERTFGRHSFVDLNERNCMTYS